MHNLVVDPLIRVRTVDGRTEAASLPEVYAASIADRVAAFPALRPHQRHAWHAFLAQLGAIALHRAGDEVPPTTPGAWRTRLRALTATFDRDEPWQLIVEDPTRPAFMQCPAPAGLQAYRNHRETPDDLDLPITARNHDLKRSAAVRSAPDDWVFTLINVQTMAGFVGGGNYGVARMNGGFSSRPCLGLAPAGGGPGTHLAHDLRRMLAARGDLLDRYPFEPDQGLALLWLHPWNGEQSLGLASLDPYCIEICRRIRLQAAGTGLVARTALSRQPRIAAKALRGDVGDFWTPVRVEEDGSQAFSVSAAGFPFDRVVALLFDFRQPSATAVDPAESPHWRLVARGMAGGRGKTQGYHERTDIVLAAETVEALRGGARRGDLTALAEAQIEEVSEVVMALRYSVAVACSGGGAPDIRRVADRARAYERRLRAAVDSRFFPALEARFLAGERPAAAGLRLKFVQGIVCTAQRLLDEASASVSCSGIYRLRARTQAARAFRRRLRRPESVFSDQPELWTSRETPARAAEEGDPLSRRLDVAGLARAVAALAPEVVAALRRRPLVGAAEEASWVLRSLLHGSTRPADAGAWGLLIQVIAILTPGRRTPPAFTAHDPARSFGAALSDAGVSELRLARLLTAPVAGRHDLVASACRRLRATRQNRFDLRSLARFVLDGDDAAAHRISLDYYGAAGVARLRPQESASDG